MPIRSPVLRIHDMLESIQGIEKAIVGKTFRDYERSWVLRSALERGIEVISEASRHLGRELKLRHKDVRWKDISGIGNILRHEYQRVDGQIIWRAVKDDLPALKEALLAIRASLNEQGGDRVRRKAPASLRATPLLRGPSRSGTAQPVEIPEVELSRSMRVLTIFFIIFVDAIFTTLFERPFTKVFDGIGATPAKPCVYLACNAD